MNTIFGLYALCVKHIQVHFKAILFIIK